jgi:hypothetical protein
VRTFRPALGALGVLLLLVFCPDSKAGPRCWQRLCRQPRCSNDCCTIPCWVRWINCGGYATCPSNYDCYCCQIGSSGPPVDCNSGTGDCQPGTIHCVLKGSGVQINCGNYGRQGCACQSCTEGCQRCYAMMCDPCCHALRFARPWECPHVYAPLNMLGWSCTICPK